MSKAVKGAVALVVLAGAGVGFAAWSAKTVGERIHQHAEQLAQGNYQVKIAENKLESSLFGATHTMTLAAGCGRDVDGEKNIVIRNRVQPGPFPGFNSFGMGRVVTEVELPESLKAELQKVFKDQAPFTIQTTIGIAGGYSTQFSVPAVQTELPESGGNLDWRGLDITVTGDLDKGLAGGGYAFDMPGLEVSGMDRDGKVQIGKVHYAGNYASGDHGLHLVAPGTGKGTIEHVTISGVAPSTGPFTLTLNDIVTTSEAKLENGLMSSVGRTEGKGKFDTFVIDKFESQVSIKRLDAIALDKFLMTALKDGMKCPDANSEESLTKNMEQQAQDLIAALLAADPEYSLDRFAVTLDGKTAELSYGLALKGMTPMDLMSGNPQALMTKGEFNMSAKVDIGWIRALVTKAAEMKKTEGTSIESVVEGGMAMANMFIDQGVSQGMLVRDGDLIKAEGAFKAGELTVNGKPMPLPF